MIVPAIDIMAGKVVRLKRGDFTKTTVYDLSPLEFAQQWRSQGAELIHIVDLDGAKTGEPKNLKIIEDIIKNVKTRFEVGGGIRRIETIKQYVEMGAERVVLSTKVIEDETFLLNPELKGFLKKIAVSIDIKQMESAELATATTAGWHESGDVLIDIPTFLQTIVSAGIRYINFSDISRDGMMMGLDTAKISLFLNRIRKPEYGKLFLTYAGGISSLEDLKKLKTLGDNGVDAVIVGKALYENQFSLKEAIEAVC